MDKTLTEQEIALLRRKLDLLLRTGQLLVESRKFWQALRRTMQQMRKVV